MTGTEMQDFTTALLGGTELGDTIFFQLANMRKGMLEAKRDWVVLRNFDNSKSFTSADDYTSTKALPDRFSRVYSPYDSRSGQQPGVYLVESSGAKFPLNPIPFASRYDYKDLDGYYYIDWSTGSPVIGRTGTIAGTLHVFYIRNTVDLAAAVTWIFPEWSHPVIPFEVAITHKGGMDYDLINSSQVPFNKEDAQIIESRLAMWDAQLQQAEIGV